MHPRFGYASLFAIIILSGTALLFTSSRSDALPTIPPKPENSMPVGKANSKAIEVNGLQFEVLLSDQEVAENTMLVALKNIFEVPKYSKHVQYPDSFKRINVVLRVTNTTNKPIYFARFGTMDLSILRADGRAVEQDVNYGLVNTALVGAALIEPNRSINRVLTGAVSWQDKQTLEIGFGGCTSCPIFFWNLEPGKYRLQLAYSNYQDEVDGIELDYRQFLTSDADKLLPPPPPKIIRSVWKEEVTLPAIKLHLVQ